MSTDRQYGNIVFSCDECGETFDRPEDDGFDVAWSLAKEDGWGVQKIDGEWSHRCKECRA